MRYRLLCVGRRARDPLLEAADAYLERLSRYTPTELVRIKEQGKAREGEALLGKVDPRARCVVLDETGFQITTGKLAARLGDWQTRGVNKVDFVIGGADGLDDSVRQRADEAWALSRLTLPHRLAQVLLLEQLYRAHTILRGEKYHRGGS